MQCQLKIPLRALDRDKGVAMLGGAKKANILRDEAIVINVDDIRRQCFTDFLTYSLAGAT